MEAGPATVTFSLQKCFLSGLGLRRQVGLIYIGDKEFSQI